jgi:aryl-alcohol dehydrogenase-like predicted oxidoreductase
MNLALGTVQFGLPYGLTNMSGHQVDFREVIEILALAKANKIRMLDTAIAYGESERVLGEAGVKGWNLITKLPRIPSQCEDVSNWVQAEVKKSLKLLQLDQLYGVLLHHPQDLMGKNGPELVGAMEQIKVKGLSQKVGVSVYEPNQYFEIEAHMRPDIVQAPVNIFDRRFIETGCIKKIITQGSEFHARSIFLQGLLLFNEIQRPKFFQQFPNVFQKWDEWIRTNNISRMEACLGYLNAISEIHTVIVGVESAFQLKTILHLLKSKKIIPPPFVDKSEFDLLNPSLWRS